jgi:hypothetical protein
VQSQSNQATFAPLDDRQQRGPDHVGILALVDAVLSVLRQQGGARQIDPTQHGCGVENRATEASVLLEP